MGRMIAVNLVAYVGVVRVATITLKRFNNTLDAQNYINMVEDVKPYDVEELECALRKFIRFPEVLIFIRKEEENMI